MNHPQVPNNRLKSWCYRDGVLGLAGAIALVWFFFRSLSLLHFVEFGDESEKFVGGLMMAQGWQLYRDLFSHHGPLPYLLVQGLHHLTGTRDGAVFRVTMVVINSLAAGAIALSPCFQRWQQRWLALTLYLGTVATLQPLWCGHMLLYQSLAGPLVVVGLALWILPVSLGCRVPAVAAWIGGCSWGLVLACSLFYGIALAMAGLYLVGSLVIKGQGNHLIKASRILPALGGWTMGAIALILAMAAHGDIQAYGVYHLYFNLAIYRQFLSEIHPFSPLSRLAQELLVQDIYWSWEGISVFSLDVLLGSTILLIPELLPPQPEKNKTWKSWGIPTLLAALLAIALLYLNLRGDRAPYQKSPAIVASLGWGSLMLGYVPWQTQKVPSFTRKLPAVALAIALGMTMVLGLYNTSENLLNSAKITLAGVKAHQVPLGISQEPIYQLIRAFTHGTEPFQALTFAPIIYLKADRLPASGHYFYLPWQAAYEKHPIAGVSINLCRDLTLKPPKFLFYGKDKIWDRYDPADYAACVHQFITTHYLPLAWDRNFYVHQDLVLAEESSPKTTPLILSQRCAIPENQPGGTFLLRPGTCPP